MKEKIKTFFSLLVLLPALPLLVTWFMQGDVFLVRETFKSGASTQDEKVKKLVGILAKEIPSSYEKETIKAQAVIARTNLYAAGNSGADEPESMTMEEMMAYYGEEFVEVHDLFTDCVKETGEEMVYVDGSPVFVPFHAVSAGYTRSALESFGQKNRTYLQSVRSTEDIQSENFLKVEFFSEKEFLELCRKAVPEISCEETEIFEAVRILSRDQGGYVIQLQIEDTILGGEEFREIFGLNSACFGMEKEDGKIRIVTKGLGHGLGFDQYGANEMAKTGKNYQELIAYYITGAEVME